MSSFQLDNDGDLLITNNAFTLTEGVEAIRQHLQCKFRLFLGEWFLDLDVGVPWFQEVFKKSTSFVVLQEIFKDTILTTPGVIQLTKFQFDYERFTREALLEFSCETTEGTIDFTQVVDA